MKIVTKSVSKSAIKSSKNNVAKTIKNAASRAAKGVKKATEHFGIKSLLDETVKTGVDFCSAWLTSKVNRGLVSVLRENKSALVSAKMLPCSGSILTVQSSKVYTWPLVAVSRDGTVYERMHGKHKVRGSITELKAIYGKSNVRVIEASTPAKAASKVLATLGKFKFEPLSRKVMTKLAATAA